MTTNPQEHPQKRPQVTRRERRDWLRSIPTASLINELQRRALAEEQLRGLILHRMSEVLAVIACQFGIRIGAEHDDVNRPGAEKWGLGSTRRAAPANPDGARRQTDLGE